MKRQEKKTIISQFAKHQKDTGSAQVQIAILTSKINHLTEHLKIHRKDNHSRKGLLGLVGQRTRLLRYVRNSQPEKYAELIKSLELRK